MLLRQSPTHWLEWAADWATIAYCGWVGLQQEWLLPAAVAGACAAASLQPDIIVRLHLPG
jgi:hypothetical protein